MEPSEKIQKYFILDYIDKCIDGVLSLKHKSLSDFLELNNKQNFSTKKDYFNI